MRTILTGVAGIAIAAVAFAASIADDGALGAGAFVLAIFVALVTLGLVMAAAVNLFVERSNDRSFAPRRQLLRGRAPGGDLDTVTCSSCGREMVRTDHIWLCERCDRFSAVR